MRTENDSEGKMTAQQEHLLKLVKEDITYHYGRSKRLKRKAYFFKISVLILSALVTVVLGLQLQDTDNGWDQHAQNFALILGALITVITAIGSFWNTEKYWLNNTLTMLQLIAIKNNIIHESKAAQGMNDATYLKLKGEYDVIQEAKIEYWEMALGEGN